MPIDRITALTHLLRMETERPLGDVTLVSNRAAAAVSDGLQTAAENLLGKGLRAILTGDRPRAEAYVARAVRLDFDDHEEINPAWWQAHMFLFEVVTDAMEDSEAGDHRWLDAAMTVLAGCGEYARTEFLRVLATIDDDWRLEPRESRRIRTAVHGLGGSHERETSPPEQDAEHVRAVLQILDAVAAFQNELEPPGE